jgi:hypothetical protein
MIPGLPGELGPLNSPLEELSELDNGHDFSVELVTADVAEAVEHAIETGITWGRIAEALRAV